MKTTELKGERMNLEKISYQIFNPGGNKTALVKGSDYTASQKQRINQMIMAKNPEVEQVGFLNQRTNRLEMAGGEFCMNATRCAVFAYANGKEGPHRTFCFRNQPNDARKSA